MTAKTSGEPRKMSADWDRDLIDQQLAEHTRRSREADPLGKRALFSAGAVRPSPLGTLSLECSSCKRESVTGAAIGIGTTLLLHCDFVYVSDEARLAMPFSVTLPRRYHSYMKCPGCGRRTWVRAHWRL